MATHSSVIAWRIPETGEPGWLPSMGSHRVRHDQSNLAVAIYVPETSKENAFNEQCKEVEENNRMGKTRDLFKKIRAIKGAFHAKMGSIKVRNGMDLTEAEDIKKRWQDTQKNCTKKVFMTQINTMV